jgi:hypothetical protein
MRLNFIALESRVDQAHNADVLQPSRVEAFKLHRRGSILRCYRRVRCKRFVRRGLPIAAV